MKNQILSLIMTDTQATNMVGCYSGQDVNTNHIDALAEKGIQFTSAYTSAPVCTPARAGLFTGIYANQSGPWTNNVAPGSNIRTMGHYFKSKNYRTGYIGKWHLDGHDYYGTGQCPEEWDADYWYDGANYLAELSDHEVALWHNGLNTAEDLRANNIGPEFTWAHRISNRALRFLDEAQENRQQPFLLVLSYDEPHHPFTCPPEYVEKYHDFAYDLGNKPFDSLQNKPEHHKLWAEAMPSPVGKDGKYRHPLYFGCNDFVDDEIGRVIKHLDQSEIDNTWVVYTSDHGEMMGAYKLISKGDAMYDDITRIPLIIRPPKAQWCHVEVDIPVSHIDILPTLLKIADIDKTDMLPGCDLCSIAQHQNSKRGVMVEFNRYEIEHDSFGGFIPVRCWIENDYKLVINLFAEDELYDRNQDLEEMDNLIFSPEHAMIRDQLHDRLLGYMDHIRDPFRSYQWSARSWRKDKAAQWMEAFRPRPNDGVAPVVRDYDTGMPTQGVKVEDKKLKF
ncbi:sulfatase-like hydrolase/transferase [Photobacterium sagamiensis]|uniref:sulfatase-like hydrolase/transferase n=1 Tax=Photobacterium sagamiensis TaxID=2910241 RepID=UPI003D13233B